MGEVADFHDCSSIPIFHLKRFWSKQMAIRNGSKLRWIDEVSLDKAVLDCLGLPLEPTITYLFQNHPDFEGFEHWIATQTDLERKKPSFQRFNQLFENSKSSKTVTLPKLSHDDLDHFHKKGYLIIREAISKESCNETVQLITQYLGIDLEDSSTWYQSHQDRYGIMVQLFQHELLEKNRHSPKIREAYECLLKTKNLWVSSDRVGFNPPETAHWKFPGPHLHLDIIPKIPMPFGLQGILYLTDTASNQGALTVVPGFHHQIEDWMMQYPTDQIPLSGVFDHLPTEPIAAHAGDFIIWNHCLPHGSSPNTHTQPRILQYINWYAVR